MPKTWRGLRERWVNQPGPSTRPAIRWELLDSGRLQLSPALLPLLGREDSWTDFDQSRKHLKDRHRSPPESLARTKATTIEFVGDARVRPLLHRKLHHQEERLSLCGIHLELVRFLRDLKAEWRLFAGWRRLGSRGRYLALPLDSNDLPALLRLTFEVFGSK